MAIDAEKTGQSPQEAGQTSKKADQPPFLVFGPAGSGLSTALDIFSDLGYLTLSGIPVDRGGDVLASLHTEKTPLAFSPRVTPGSPPETAGASLVALRQALPNLRVLRLDAPEETLIQRYLHSQKPHGFETAVASGLKEAIAAEKQWFSVLGGLPELKDYSIDTSTTTVVELRNKVARILGLPVENREFTVYINTFGFKYGAPPDAELMFDMRFMTNPFYDEALRPLTGRDKPVRDFIFKLDYASAFFEQWSRLVADLLPRYREEGKTRLAIAIGCTGGKHRSVCMAEELARYLVGQCPDFRVVLNHREMRRWGQAAETVSIVPSSVDSSLADDIAGHTSGNGAQPPRNDLANLAAPTQSTAAYPAENLA
jgi:UPF0042 nucleotide-binding protein